MPGTDEREDPDARADERKATQAGRPQHADEQQRPARERRREDGVRRELVEEDAVPRIQQEHDHREQRSSRAEHARGEEPRDDRGRRRAATRPARRTHRRRNPATRRRPASRSACARARSPGRSDVTERAGRSRRGTCRGHVRGQEESRSPRSHQMQSATTKTIPTAQRLSVRVTARRASRDQASPGELTAIQTSEAPVRTQGILSFRAAGASNLGGDPLPERRGRRGNGRPEGVGGHHALGPRGRGPRRRQRLDRRVGGGRRRAWRPGRARAAPRLRTGVSDGDPPRAAASTS